MPKLSCRVLEALNLFGRLTPIRLGQNAWIYTMVRLAEICVFPSTSFGGFEVETSLAFRPSKGLNKNKDVDRHGIQSDIMADANDRNTEGY